MLTHLSGFWGMAGGVTRVDSLQGGEGLIDGTGERTRKRDRWERDVGNEGERKMSG